MGEVMTVPSFMSSLEVYNLLEAMPYVVKKSAYNSKISTKATVMSDDEINSQERILVKTTNNIERIRIDSFYWYKYGKLFNELGAAYFKFEIQDDIVILYSYDYSITGLKLRQNKEWLRDNGINPYFFEEEDLMLIRMKFLNDDS